MKRILNFRTFLALITIAAGIQSEAKYGWSSTKYDSKIGRYEYSCSVQTEVGDFVTWTDESNCKHSFGWNPKKWDSNINRWEFGCAIQTDTGEFSRWADDFKDCKQNFGFSPKSWNSALSRWEFECALQTNEKEFIRFVPLENCTDSPQVTSAKLSIEELNKKIQPPEGTQIILAVDLAIPGQKGCGAPRENANGIQCWVCQDQAIRNGILYTKERILEVQSVKVLRDRKEFQFNLVNDTDGLNLVRCISKSSIIPAQAPEDLASMLLPSGLLLKTPSLVVK